MQSLLERALLLFSFNIIPFVLLHVHIYIKSKGGERKRSSIMRRDDDSNLQRANNFETRVHTRMR